EEDVHLRADAPRADPLDLREELEVLFHRQAPVDVAIPFEDRTDAAHRPAGCPDRVDAIDGDASGARTHERGDAFDRCGLAGTVRSEETDDLSLVDAERDAVHRVDIATPPAAVDLRQLVDGNDGCPLHGDTIYRE